MTFIATVDGPAASGKTSVSRELARRFNWQWVSTGAFYRGLAYVAHKLGISAQDKSELIKILNSSVWSVQLAEDNTKVWFQGKDVTDQIFAEQVGSIASVISQIPEVREGLLGPQRACARAEMQGLVAEGRDCGTVVFPGARVKVFLTANSSARAERRAREQNLSVQGVIESQKQRDQADTNRQVAPMKAAENALIVDTSSLNLEQVVDQIENFVRSKY